MKTVILILVPIFLLLANSVFAQASHSSESMNTRDVNTNAKLQLLCDNCAAITEVEVRGEGVCFSATYSGDAWREIFPKTIDVAAGDYMIRFKQNAGKWKTLHVYISKHKQQTLLLN